MTGAGAGEAAAAAGAGAGAASKSNNSVRAASVEALAEHVGAIFTHPRARFVLKYRHSDAKLSLRVTDDVKTAKYKTRRQADLGKVKRLVGAVISGKEPDGAFPWVVCVLCCVSDRVCARHG